MNEPVIRVENISKSYYISHKATMRAGYGTLKDDLANLLKKPFSKRGDESREIFWALRNIDFEVNKGEIFGIIGRNGAGKSTLLKILSRIAEPTQGVVTMKGRVASLLEVGTGFHPELTGRENIFFNGSMLGMSRQEIRKKFDQIVEFSEVEKFIDTPVKFYSSGMYVRLAFSVAAYLESEILILDEVLSVGDAGFQQKSLNKILSSMEEGRTVLFVSHSMSAVQQLCNRGILLKNGRVDYIGETGELVERYLENVQKESPPGDAQGEWADSQKLKKNEYFTLEKMYIVDSANNKVLRAVPNNQDYFVTIDATIKKASPMLTIGYAIYTATRTFLYMSYPTDKPQSEWPKMPVGKIRMRGKIPKHLLNEGKYKISIVGGLHNKFWIFEPGTKAPSVELYIYGGLSESPYWKQAREGLLAPVVDWELTSR